MRFPILGGLGWGGEALAVVKVSQLLKWGGGEALATAKP